MAWLGMQGLIIELLQVSVCKRDLLSRVPSPIEWDLLFSEFQKQALIGVGAYGVSRLPKTQQPPVTLWLKWIAIGETIKINNYNTTKRIRELEEFFSNGGFRSCVLKGQGTALYYPDPTRRQSGDIDIWVEGGREDIIEFVRNCKLKISNINIKHADLYIFEDVTAEVHFIPSWMYSPFKNSKLHEFFKGQIEAQFNHFDYQAGFTHPTVEFDLVYSLVHIYRHVFDEGIGLRHLLDYYYILLHSNQQQRNAAFSFLRSFGMSDFTGGVMYVCHKCFALEKKLYLCDVNERHGVHLLSEILKSGNLGHYDNRYKSKNNSSRINNGFVNFHRNIHYLCYYPSEVLWAPIWKVWHWYWRKSRCFMI